MGNWYVKNYLDSQMKGKMASQNIVRLSKQVLMAPGPGVGLEAVAPRLEIRQSNYNALINLCHLCPTPPPPPQKQEKLYQRCLPAQKIPGTTLAIPSFFSSYFMPC